MTKQSLWEKPDELKTPAEVWFHLFPCIKIEIVVVITITHDDQIIWLLSFSFSCHSALGKNIDQKMEKLIITMSAPKSHDGLYLKN